MNPNLASACNRKAVAEYAKGQFNAAERDLMEAQSRDPFNLAHSATLAELYHSWSRFDAEARVAQRMLAGLRITTMPSKLLAEVAFAQGRYSDVTSLVARVSNYLDVPTQIGIGDRLRALDNLADFRRTHPDFPLCR